jgi:ATP-dependent RNA helicase DDX24/MAK5
MSKRQKKVVGDNLSWETSYTDGSSLPATSFGGTSGAELCFKLDVLPASAYTLEKAGSGGFIIKPSAPRPQGEGAAGAPAGKPSRKRKRKGDAPFKATAPSAAAVHEEEGEQQEQEQQQQQESQGLQAPQPAQPAARVSAFGPRNSAASLSAVDVASTWAPFGPLRAELVANLARLNYGAPTAVQRSVLPEAIRNFKDIVATAATGSGKTAAYALPILQRLLDRREAEGMGTLGKGLRRWATLPALVLVPTRELALQVRDHINALAAGTPIRAVATVGGLATEKQARLVRAHPDIVVATPGRLAELMASQSLAPFLSMDLSTVQMLVLDEADRMVEKGSFDSLRVIFAALKGSRQGGEGGAGGASGGGAVDEVAEAVVKRVKDDGLKELSKQAGGKGMGRGEEGGEGGGRAHPPQSQDFVPWRASFKRQTFLFSATLGATSSAVHAKDAALALVQAQAYAEGAGGEDGKLSGKALKRALARVEGVTAVEALVAMCECSGKPLIVRVAGGGADAPSSAAALVGKLQAAATLPSSSSSSSSSSSPGGEDPPAEDSATVIRAKHAGETLQPRALALPAGLRLGRISCASVEDKECALYSFLQRFPGRTLVFVNSITGLKKLALLLTALKCPAFTLHASMEQKARIKHLERFVAAAGAPPSAQQQRGGCAGTPRLSVLLATDVAARGLDLPFVDAVIHFSLPPTAETFVHRSGRTARGPGGKGLSLALVGPKDAAVYSRLCGTLGMVTGLADFPEEPGISRAVAARVAAARELAELEASLAEESASAGWLVRQAEEMGVDIDEQTRMEVGGLAEAGGGGRRGGGEGEGGGGGGGGIELTEEEVARSQKRRLMIKGLKRTIAGLLAAPLIPTGTSKRYITGNPLLSQALHPLQTSIVLGEGGAAAAAGEGGSGGGAAAAPPPPPQRSGSALVGLKVLPSLGLSVSSGGGGGGKQRASAPWHPNVLKGKGALHALVAGGRHAHVPAAKQEARKVIKKSKWRK